MEIIKKSPNHACILSLNNQLKKYKYSFNYFENKKNGHAFLLIISKDTNK